jgi:hypothetical protein
MGAMTMMKITVRKTRRRMMRRTMKKMRMVNWMRPPE